MNNTENDCSVYAKGGTILMEGNKKMTKRLSWIDAQDSKQASFLSNYLSRHDNFWISKSFVDVRMHSAEEVVKKFLDLADTWEENAENRELCRNMKSAWKTWERRQKNKNTKSENSYTISKEARNKLEKLSRQNNVTMSTTVERLIMQAEEIQNLQKQLHNLLKNCSLGKYGIRSFTEVLLTLLAEDPSKAQNDLLRKQITDEISQNYKNEKQKLKERFEKLRNEKIKLEEELLAAQQDIEQLLS